MDFDGPIVVILDLHAGVPFCNPQVCHIEFGGEPFLDIGDIIIVLADDEQIVDVESDVGCTTIPF